MRRIARKHKKYLNDVGEKNYANEATKNAIESEKKYNIRMKKTEQKRQPTREYVYRGKEGKKKQQPATIQSIIQIDLLMHFVWHGKGKQKSAQNNAISNIHADTRRVDGQRMFCKWSI